MKVQCDLCREIVPLAEFSSSAEGITIVCPSCRGTYFVAAPAAPAQAAAESHAVGSAAVAAAGPATAGTGMICPKCGRSQPEADACRYCGLLVERWSPEAAAGAGPDDEARQLFAAAEEQWDDPARHEAFIQHCSQTGALPFAARCYRERLARAPDDAVARAQQARVVAVAEFTFLQRPREIGEAPLPHRGVLIGMVVALFLLLLGTLTSPLWRWWK